MHLYLTFFFFFFYDYSSKKTPSFSDLKFDMSEGGHKLDLVDSSGVVYQTHMPMPMMVPMQYEPGKLGNLLVCTMACTF